MTNFQFPGDKFYKLFSDCRFKPRPRKLVRLSSERSYGSATISITTFSVMTLSTVTLSITMNRTWHNRHLATHSYERRYAWCHIFYCYAECHYSGCYICYCYVKCHYSGCQIFYCYADQRYAGIWYTECPYAECRGADIYRSLLYQSSQQQLQILLLVNSAENTLAYLFGVLLATKKKFY